MSLGEQKVLVYFWRPKIADVEYFSYRMQENQIKKYNMGPIGKS